VSSGGQYHCRPTNAARSKPASEIGSAQVTDLSTTRKSEVGFLAPDARSVSFAAVSWMALHGVAQAARGGRAVIAASDLGGCSAACLQLLAVLHCQSESPGRKVASHCTVRNERAQFPCGAVLWFSRVASPSAAADSLPCRHGQPWRVRCCITCFAAFWELTPRSQLAYAHLMANPDVRERHKHHDRDAPNSHGKEERPLYDELTTKLTVRVKRLVPLDKIQQRKDVAYTQRNPPLSWFKTGVQFVDDACDCGAKAPAGHEHRHQEQHTDQDVQQCRSGYILSAWLLAPVRLDHYPSDALMCET
jgi:hypothetical protein